MNLHNTPALRTTLREYPFLSKIFGAQPPLVADCLSGTRGAGRNDINTAPWPHPFLETFSPHMADSPFIPAGINSDAAIFSWFITDECVMGAFRLTSLLQVFNPYMPRGNGRDETVNEAKRKQSQLSWQSQDILLIGQNLFFMSGVRP